MNQPHATEIAARRVAYRTCGPIARLLSASEVASSSPVASRTVHLLQDPFGPPRRADPFGPASFLADLPGPSRVPV